MKSGRKSILLFLGLLALVMAPINAMSAASPEAPSDWKPTKPIRIIVSEAAGSSYDLIARIIGQGMGKILNQPVYVENMTGGGQMVGQIYVYRAAPDGYTLLYTGSTFLLLNQLVHGADYEYRKFEYLDQTIDTMTGLNGVAASTKNGLKSWSDVLKLNRPVRFADPGKGSVAHLTSLALAKAYNLKAVYITGYKGTDSIMAVVRGECDLNTIPPPIWKQYVVSGDLSIVLWTSTRPLSAFSSEDVGWIPPSTPSVTAQGHPEVAESTGTTHLLLAPPATPKKVADVLRSAAYSAIVGQDMKTLIQKLNYSPSYAPLSDPKAIEKGLSKSWERLKTFEPLLKQ